MASWYSAVLEQQASSGLSVTDFAEHAGVSPCTLYQWRRRLSGRSLDRISDSVSVDARIARSWGRNTVIAWGSAGALLNDELAEMDPNGLALDAFAWGDGSLRYEVLRPPVRRD